MDPTTYSFEAGGPECDYTDEAATNEQLEGVAASVGQAQSIGDFMLELGAKMRADEERAQNRAAAFALARGIQFLGEAAAVIAGFVVDTVATNPVEA